MSGGAPKAPDPGMLADAASDPANRTSTQVIPQDAASILIYDITGTDVRILMGQRGAATQFMPNRYVFPGGRVDPTDHTIAAPASPIAQSEVAKLLLKMAKPVAAERAHGLAIAAVRETFEEAGLVFGTHPDDTPASPSGDGIWASFAEHAAAPNLNVLTYFARAITPPGQKRRYDTRFFCAPRDAVLSETGVTDGELSKLAWYPLPELEALNLAPITKAILGEFKQAMQSGALAARCPSVTFYYQSKGVFRREILALEAVKDG